MTAFTTPPSRICVDTHRMAMPPQTWLAVRELLTGLRLLHPTLEVKQATNVVAAGVTVLTLAFTKQNSKAPEGANAQRLFFGRAVATRAGGVASDLHQRSRAERRCGRQADDAPARRAEVEGSGCLTCGPQCLLC